MKIVIAMTGASGAIFSFRLCRALQALKDGPGPEHEIHVVASENAHLVWRTELDQELASALHPEVKYWERHNFSAPFASGSNAPDAVIVAPCSMSTLARVAHGGGNELIARSCEVALKERKQLLLMVRETPFSRVHLQNMLSAHDAGATIMPAIPSYYAGVKDLAGAVDSVIARALDHVGVPNQLLERWGEDKA